jgi:hypothetical protein
MRIFLSGPDHDKQADVFKAAVLELGVARLELPFKESIDVVPLGDVSIVQDHVGRSNETAFDVVFVETNILSKIRMRVNN